MSENTITKPVKFHLDVSLGQVMSVVVFMFAAAGSYYGMKNEVALVDMKVTRITADVAKVERSIEKMTSIIEVMVRQDERMMAVVHRIDRLERALERAVSAAESSRSAGEAPSRGAN